MGEPSKYKLSCLLPLAVGRRSTPLRRCRRCAHTTAQRSRGAWGTYIACKIAICSLKDVTSSVARSLVLPERWEGGAGALAQPHLPPELSSHAPAGHLGT
eukprot:scaffold284259_cov37-Tisochrysis_lutea.AAC.2